MKAHGSVASILVAGLVAVGITVLPGAAQEPKSGAPKSGPQTTTATAPVYKPPLRGAPSGRVGGGTRSGSARDMFVLSALVPVDSGLTTSEQPVLYWFISNATTLPVEVAISDPRATQPLLETRLPSPVQPGVHRIKLADHGVRLAPGVAYRWSVSVISDVNRRSKDILAGGVIERVEAPTGLRQKLALTPSDQYPFIYADAGLWYDALDSISNLIELRPNDAQLQKQRSALLTQVGLPEIGDAGR
jgi:Domain of Unknown Function (DUF928)